MYGYHDDLQNECIINIILLVIVVHVELRPIETAENYSEDFSEEFSHVRKMSLDAQPVFRCLQLSGCLVDGSSSWGGSKVSGITDSSRGSIDMVRVSHDGGGNGLLDDGLSLDGDWDSDVVRGINMDGGWDLNDLLGVEGSIIRGINLALNKDRALDVVDLSLGLDNGGVDSLGSLEDSWDSDGKMRGGWLVDLSGVSGHIAGLAEVHLLKEADNEKGNHGTVHVNSSHLLSVEVVGDAIFVRNVVIKVTAPGLHRAHVQVKGWTLRGLGLLSRVALPEEPPGPCEVEGGVRDLGH